VIKDYAEFVDVPEPLARRVRDEFFPKALLWPDEIKGLDGLMTEAVTLKFLSAPLMKEQIADFVRIPAMMH
jgi:NitT/TauT family transport system substrate-binding protein